MKTVIVILFTISPLLGNAQVNVIQMNDGRYAAIGQNIPIGKGSISGTNFKTNSSNLHFGKYEKGNVTLYVNFFSVAQLNIPEGAVVKITFNNKQSKEYQTKKDSKAQYDEKKYYYNCNFWVNLPDEDVKTLIGVGVSRLEMSYSKIKIVWSLKNKYSAIIKSGKEIVSYKF